MTGDITPDKETISLVLGCDPQVTVTIVEKLDGGLFLTIVPNGPDVDIDGLFLNLTNEGLLPELNFFPLENEGSEWAPVTDIETGINAINSMSDGDMLRDEYDVRVEFGQVPDSTEGVSISGQVTLWGPQLTIEDLDLDNIAVVVNSDGGAGQVLLPEGGQDSTQMVETVALSEDFNAIENPDDSDAIQSDAGWDVRYGKLFTNGSNDGSLVFEEVTTDGPVSLTLDARGRNLDEFENSGRYEDTLRIEVQIDGGDWQLLDEFRVNDEGTALVGSETGQEIGSSMDQLSYSGGILDDAEDTAQFRFVSDISANNEKIQFDNVEIMATEETTVPGGEGDAQCIDFDDLEAGDVVGDQYDGVTISAQRDGDAETSENDAMVFDSQSPTGGDWDLGFDNQQNILIVSEDNDSSDPDDEAHGGTISISFEDPAQVLSLNVLDIEEENGVIDLFDADGELINSIDIPITGNNGQAEVQIDTANVSSMNVVLSGSGAIDDLCYVPGDDPDVCDAQYDLGSVGGLPLLPLDTAEHTIPCDDEEIMDDMLV